ANQVRKDLSDLAPEYLDVEVYLRVIAKGELKDGDRILFQSDQARILKDPDQVQQYIEQVKAKVPAYLRHRRELAKAQAVERAKAQKQVQQPVYDRASYEKLAQQVKNQLFDIPSKQFDAFVFKLAQAKGLDGDRILAQSDMAQKFRNTEAVARYIGQMKQLANRLDWVPGADVSSAQRQLNERALKSCVWLTETYGEKQNDGWTVFEGNQFSYHAKEGEYKIYSRAQQRNVLVFGNNRLVSALSLKEVEKLELSVEKGKTMIAETQQAQIKAKELKKERGPRR
ncbi:MAG: hypothetical protein HC852_22175, partial [Acaryochloridaceae cyanobacterium RU_4_10]|nr:hypothetical protein [Acaryochloridaceae cyanobacterium RU_4_10]